MFKSRRTRPPYYFGRKVSTVYLVLRQRVFASIQENLLGYIGYGTVSN